MALYINRKSKTLTVVSTIGQLSNRRDSLLLFSVRAERAPREMQKVLNTVNSLRKQFAQSDVTLDVSNVKRAHLTEKNINHIAAHKLARYLYAVNSRALYASARALAKYGI